jgi:hypothetical protein
MVGMRLPLLPVGMVLVIVSVLLSFATFAFAQLPTDLQRQFDEAERRIVRLSPTAFLELPRSVVGELQHRGCTIPQTAYTKERSNVIKGQFAKPGQSDWAVLCSVKGTSSILVFWNGSEKNLAELARQQDRTYLEGIDENHIGFGRDIEVVGRDFIVDHYKAYGGPKPPPIDHEAINDAFIEKASVVHYFYRGKWLELQGAD